MKTLTLTAAMSAQLRRVRRWFLNGLDGYRADAAPRRRYDDVPDYLRDDVGLRPPAWRSQSTDPPRIGPML